MSITIDLSGKVAVVTGASRGIGRECARTLAAAGALVILNYNKSADKAETAAREICELDGKAECFRADVSQPDEVQRLFEHVRKTHGRVDILVNNAGILRDK